MQVFVLPLGFDLTFFRSNNLTKKKSPRGCRFTVITSNLIVCQLEYEKKSFHEQVSAMFSAKGAASKSLIFRTSRKWQSSSPVSGVTMLKMTTFPWLPCGKKVTCIYESLIRVSEYLQWISMSTANKVVWYHIVLYPSKQYCHNKSYCIVSLSYNIVDIILFHIARYHMSSHIVSY